MGNKDIDNAIAFLQGATDSETVSPAKGTASPRSETSVSQQENEPTVSGLEPPKRDTILPPSGTSAPLLPGMADPEPVTPPPVVHIAAEKSPLKLHPPAQRRTTNSKTTDNNAKRPVFRINAILGLSALSGILGIGLIVALICLMRTPEPPVAQIVATDIPLALLPESADPTLWETVSRMHGEINGTALAFDRGQATDAVGTAYKVQLDFCRKGSDIYAKVEGKKTYVVRLDDHGKITKVYPAPKNNKPLRDIFGK